MVNNPGGPTGLTWTVSLGNYDFRVFRVEVFHLPAIDAGSAERVYLNWEHGLRLSRGSK